MLTTFTSCRDEPPPYVEPFGVVNYTSAGEYVDHSVFDALDSYGSAGDSGQYTSYEVYDVSKGPVYILASGVYRVTGESKEGFIHVSPNVGDTGTVVLILDNLNIDLSGKTGFYPPIYSEGCDLTLVLKSGSVNTLCDSQGNIESGAISVKRGNLTIEGNGRLNISAKSSKNGIHCGRSIEIKGGIFDINANNHGIYGKEGLSISGGIYTVEANRFGIKSGDSPSELNPVNTVGDMSLSGCRMNISCLENGIDVNGVLDIYSCGITVKSGQNGIKSNDSINVGSVSSDTLLIIDSGTDGLDSDRNIEITGKTDLRIRSSGDGIVGNNVTLSADGEIYIETNGEHEKNQLGDYILKDGKYHKVNPIDYPNEELYDILVSCKGIKALDKITVSKGNIAISSMEDGVHSNDFLMFGGRINIVTDEDGIHALVNTTVNDGELCIHKSFKGVKASSVYIGGGMLQVASFSDGIDCPFVTVDDGEVYLFDKVDVGISGIFEVNGGTVLIVASSSKPCLPTKSSLNSVKCTVERPQYAMHTNLLNVYGGGIFVTSKLPKGYTEKISVSLISDKLVSGEYIVKIGSSGAKIKEIVSFDGIDIADAYVQKLHK